jgi:hypothetical protein
MSSQQILHSTSSLLPHYFFSPSTRHSYSQLHDACNCATPSSLYKRGKVEGVAHQRARFGSTSQFDWLAVCHRRTMIGSHSFRRKKEQRTVRSSISPLLCLSSWSKNNTRNWCCTQSMGHLTIQYLHEFDTAIVKLPPRYF